MKLYFDLMFDDFTSLPNQQNAENYVIIKYGLVYAIKYMKPMVGQQDERIIGIPFFITERYEPYGDKKYEIIFYLEDGWKDDVYDYRNGVAYKQLKKMNITVNINWWLFIWIRLTQKWYGTERKLEI